MPLSSLAVASISLLVVLLIMLIEVALSRANERWLRVQSAYEPAGDVYRTMQWAYPAAFVAMALDGALVGPAPGVSTVIGGVLLVAAKTLKAWAIVSLGRRWTYRVLVLPNVPLVSHGPYAVVRHPNYMAVLGELVGMAVLVGARVAGPVATIAFALLLRRRIIVEERALANPL